MADKTGISWTDSTWNPVVGCTIVSPGCTNCYAMEQAARIIRCSAGPGRATHYEGTVQPSKAGPVWTGKVALAPDSTLMRPLSWRKGKRIFVNSMGDLFHDAVPDEWIDRVFAVMALAPQHQFQVLTKRARRMREYVSNPATPFRVAKAKDALSAGNDAPEEIRPVEGYPGYFASTYGKIYSERRGGPRRAMKPDVGERGHSRVQLHREGSGERGDRLLVHRIILETFVGPAPSTDAQGRHRDGNAQNNRISNLMWGTQEENWTDAKRHGSHRRYSKLTEEQATEIRRRHAAGESGEAMAREFPVSSTQIRNIASGRQWNVEPAITWPLPNIWKGVTAEDQTRADERIPDLLATPAALRFVSVEPMLGAVDLKNITPADKYELDALSGFDFDQSSVGPRLDWVVCGGESGPGARPMQVGLARSIVAQCRDARVPCFVKQLGSDPVWEDGAFLNLRHRKGATMSEWPADLHVQEIPNAR